MIFNYEKFKADRYRICSSQHELSKLSGISENTIKNIESGRKRIKYNDYDFINLCKVLNFNPNDYFLRECKVIFIGGLKGGLGKSITTATIASILATKHNKNVIVIDGDCQTNVSQSLGVLYDKDFEVKNIYNAFTRQESILNHLIDTDIPNLKIVPGSLEYSKIEAILPQLSYREVRFKAILNETINSGEYDFILIDSSPSLSLTNNIMLRASDYALLPFNPDVFSLSGIENTLNFIYEINEENKLAGIKHQIKILGLFCNKYDKRIKMSSAITKVVKEVYSEHMLKSIIPVDSAISKTISENKPLSENYSKTKAYEAFCELTEEILHVIK